jgi:hypothetical protein
MKAFEELYIQDANGEYQLVDLPAGQVALNFQEINLLKLESLFATYSQNIKLPKTNRNRSVFASADLFDIGSEYASRRSSCLYYVNGVEILGKEYVFMLDSVGENFEGRIVSDVTDLYKVMKDTKLADVDLQLPLTRSLSAVANEESAGWYKFLCAYFTDDGKRNNGYAYLNYTDFKDTPLPNFEIQYMLPFLSLNNIFERVAAHFGYSASREGNSEIYADYYFPIVPKRKGEAVAWKTERIHEDNQYKGSSDLPNNLEGALALNAVVPFPDMHYLGHDFEVDGSVYVEWTKNAKYIGAYLSITARVDAKVSFSYAASHDNSVGTGGNKSVVALVRKGDVLIDGKLNEAAIISGELFEHRKDFDGSFSTPEGEMAEFEAEKDVEYCLFLLTPSVVTERKIYNRVSDGAGNVTSEYVRTEYIYENVNATFEGSLKMSPLMDEEQAIAGDSVAVEKSMPFETCFDLFSTYIRANGLFVRVNAKSKTVQLTPVSEILGRSSAVDWSKKLCLDGKAQKILFKHDFERNNYLKFLENRDTAEVDRCNITLSNGNLTGSKDILTIDTESLRTVKLTYRSNIALTHNIVDSTAYVLDDEGGISAKEIGVQLVNADLGRVSIGIGGGVSIRNLAIKVDAARMVRDTYKPLFERLFKKLRTVEATFLLDERDVANFNQLAPVYVDYYGAYFFVNKISNWMAGKPCKVELIKL